MKMNTLNTVPNPGLSDCATRKIARDNKIQEKCQIISFVLTKDRLTPVNSRKKIRVEMP